jgi:hypothetical protein
MGAMSLDGSCLMRAARLALLFQSLLIPALVNADVVELRSGGKVAGTVKRVEQERAPYVVVDVDDSKKIRVAIPESQIARVAESATLNEYRQRANAVKDIADEHYDLARWCKGSHLPAQYRHHMERVISIDADHPLARAALGFVEYEGKWIRHAELQKKRGLVLIAGEYRLPEEVAIREVQEEANVAAKRWAKEIERLRKAVLRGGDNGSQAFASLAAIDDPNASFAMAAELLNSAKQPQNLRMFWIDKLTAFANRPALEAFVETGINDADSVVREKALEALQKISPSTAIANYRPPLRSNDNGVVVRAANALSYFPDPEIALALVDALVTEHKYETPASQGTNVGFGEGGGGLSTGGKATVTVTKIQNPPVLAVLRAIEPDVDFGYDQARWRRFYADRLSSYSGDMRRDL